MQALKQFVEWYLGVPPASPGQGTAWNFDFRTPWPSWLPPWAVLLIVLAAIAVIVWIYVRDARTLVPWKRLSLIALRIGAAGVLLLFLTELTLSVDRTGLPFVAVLIDDSASMGFEDQYSDEQLQQQAQELIAEAGYDEITRMNLAKAILTRNDGEFLKGLLREHKLRVYRFSDSAHPVGRSAYLDPGEIDELLPLLKEMPADGLQTRPGPAVKKVLDDFRGTPPSAIVILTDGITSTSDSDKLTTAADAALGRLVPIYTVGIGSEEPARDLQLYDLLVDEVAFVGDPITFSAKLKAFGFEGQTTQLVLREKGQSEILASTEVRVGPDGRPTKLELTYTPPQEGEFDYELEVTPLPRETNTKNNAETRQVSVREEKIRVLLADSLPRYEFRFVKHLLEREKTIELDTVLQDADLEYAAEDETALPHFPVRQDELFKYDVIVFGDVNPAYLSSGVFNNLREFVREKGGGIVMVAGGQHNPLKYRGTPLEIMLPIELSGVQVPSPDLPITQGFRPSLTLEARRGSGIFRFGDTEDESLMIWNRLPELYWMIEAPRLKSGAIVFAEHPTLRGENGKLPVIALQRFGAGKVLFHATDELWRWRFRVGDLYYGRYWIQAIRYLSRSRLLAQDRSAELTSDRMVYQRGDTVYLRVRFLDERMIPAEQDGVSVMVERQGDVQRPVQLNRSTQSPAIFEGTFSQAGEGMYHAWIARPSFSEAPPSTGFRVEAPQQELQRRSLDRYELTETAKLTHGRYFNFAEATTLASVIPAGEPVPLESEDPVPLWNRWELLLLFSAVLMSEWLLRKRYRLI